MKHRGICEREQNGCACHVDSEKTTRLAAGQERTAADDVHGPGNQREAYDAEEWGELGDCDRIENEDTDQLTCERDEGYSDGRADCDGERQCNSDSCRARSCSRAIPASIIVAIPRPKYTLVFSVLIV